MPNGEIPGIELKKIAQASGACQGLCGWVRALQTYDRVINVVKPTKAAVNKAHSEVAEAMANLATKLNGHYSKNNGNNYTSVALPFLLQQTLSLEQRRIPNTQQRDVD